MKNKKITLIIVMTLSIGILVSCTKDSKENQNSVSKTEQNQQIKDNVDKADNADKIDSGSSANNTEDGKDNATQSTQDAQSPSGNKVIVKDISEKVKDYIINGQGDKPEALKLKWSNEFLNKIDIENLYTNYMENGGESEDIERFAEYITLNAPILNGWEELFKKNLFDVYGEEVVKLEHLEGDLYQAYISKNGSEVPYVVVSARTGYFHG